MSSSDVPRFPPPPVDDPPESLGADAGGVSGAPPPVAQDPESESERVGPEPLKWKKNALMFAITVPSVFLAGYGYSGTLAGSASFALSLLAILLFHEFGHYIAARIHGVPASLPFFIPLPVLSPLGTMGAVIVMRGRIKSRNALLDIGAAGPLAGMVVALPVLAWGISESKVGPFPEEGFILEGQSLLYLGMKALFADIPPGHDLQMSPMAFAGWAGLLVTMINMIPWGQLDGGHVAYALLGPRHNRIAPYVRRGLLVLFVLSVAYFGYLVSQPDGRMSWGYAFSNSSFYLVWFVVLGVLGRMSGGRDHPPTDPGELSPVRRWVAIGTLFMFVLLFMPSPLMTFDPDPNYVPPPTEVEVSVLLGLEQAVSHTP